MIVYRNPLDAAIWESLMNGGLIIVAAIMFAALCGVGVYALIDSAHSKACRKWRYSGRQYKTVATLYLHAGKIGIATSVIVLVLMHMRNMYDGCP